jgi:hypothetical protein
MDFEGIVMESYLIFCCIVVLPPLLISIYRGLTLVAIFVIFIISAIVSPAIAVAVVMDAALSGPGGDAGPYMFGILLVFSPYAIALLWGKSS